MLLNKEAECTLLLSTHAMLFVSVSVLFVTMFFNIDSLVTRPDNLMSLLPFVTRCFVVGSFFSTFQSHVLLFQASERPFLRPMKFLRNHSSGYASQISPTNSARFTQTSSNPSPNSSG